MLKDTKTIKRKGDKDMVGFEKTPSIYDVEYQDWLKELKSRYRQSQIKASIKVNTELLKFYWSLGRDIVKIRTESKWGGNFYETLSNDLKKAFPDSKGFSKRNLIYCKKFYELFVKKQEVPQLGAPVFMIPWNHIKTIMDKVNGNIDKALFYVKKTIENNWSRAVLMNFLDSNLYEREGKALNNFELTLPKENSDLAKEITKDPYSFSFLTLKEGYKEKELKEALIENIKEFLLELGTGFAYMGKEFRLDFDNTEIFLDVLFYNTNIHAYVVIEVKVADFKPADVGQLGTYVVAVDHLLKSDRDEKTIGLLICKEKNKILANYSLEASNQPLGISSYELSNLVPEKFKSSLPTIEEIEKELNK